MVFTPQSRATVFAKLCMIFVAGLGIALAVDLFHGEGLSRDVVLEAVIGADARLAPVLLGGGLVHVAGAVVGLGGTDLELHALVEEEVAVSPEFLREVRLDLVELLVGDDIAFLEGRLVAGIGAFLRV